MRRRGWTVVAGAVIVLALAGLLAQMPVPYVALAPGRAVNTLGVLRGDDVIRIEGASVERSSGQLSFTTVSVYDGLDLFTALRMWFDDDIAVVPRETIYPPGQSREELDRESEADFVSSQKAAQIAALRELGYETRVAVAKLQKGSPAQSLLEADDVLTTVNGESFDSVGKFLNAVADHKPGSTIEVGYERDGAAGVATVPVRAEKKGSKVGDIGVTLKYQQEHAFTVSFDVNGIGGPSAGLMFALGIVDKLDPTNITGGTNIAGTGTIDDDGEVGPIGGISQKMIAARETGATLFLTPQDNCEQAKKTKPDGLRLVRVDELNDALKSLKVLRDGGSAVPSC